MYWEGGQGGGRDKGDGVKGVGEKGAGDGERGGGGRKILGAGVISIYQNLLYLTDFTLFLWTSMQ